MDPRVMTADEVRSLGHGQPLLKAVRANCVDCCGGSEVEVLRCGHVKCPMWPFRMGTNPFNRRDLSDDQRAAIGLRLRTARGGRSS